MILYDIPIVSYSFFDHSTSLVANPSTPDPVTPPAVDPVHPLPVHLVHPLPDDPVAPSPVSAATVVVDPDHPATMAANAPAKLKAADLSRFIQRAAQLETAKPVVAYWCEYWIVNQILSKELHNGDKETMAYTMALMDKLEKVKADNATNDAIIDDTAGQAYVEQFALETFQRADRAVQANKVTKQTVDTFSAAVTFFELINIWNPPDSDVQAKIKYAKWNAVRIAKALREGKDPNESNPKPAPQPDENLPELDPNDPEVQGLEGPVKPRQASVEEVPDEQDRVEQKLARQSSIDQSLHPSAQVSARASPAPIEPYPRDGFPYTVVQDDNVSPLEPSPPNDRNGSVGGGYFPEVPTFTSESSEVPHPTAPPEDVLDLGLPEQPSFNPSSTTTDDFEPIPPPTLDESPTAPPQDYYKAPPNISQPHVYYAPPIDPQQFQPQPPQFQSLPPQYQPPQQQYRAPPPQAAIPQPTTNIQNRKEQFNTDDVAIAKAQKHARWAISALNFEDAETAVKELRDALKTLGAS